MGRRGIALLSIGWATALTVCAQGADSSGVESAAVPASRIAAWLDEQIAEGRGLPLDDLRDVAVRFAYELHTLTPPAEIERLRTEIKGHPDHPKRPIVESYDRRLELGPSIHEYTARVRGWEDWRLNQDRTDGDALPWNDTVVTPTHAYQLNPDRIALIDPRVGYPPGRQINTRSNEFWNAINLLLYADLGSRPGQELSRSDVRVGGEHWSCDVSKPGRTIRYEGRWVTEWDRPVVDRATTIDNPDDPKDVGWFKVFGDWRMDPVLGRPVVARAEQRFPDGSIVYAYIFRSAEREDADVFDRVTAVPDIAGADPLRGPITATGLWDFREGSQRYIADPLGAQSVVDQGPFPGARSVKETNVLRRAGWMLLGAIVLGLIAVRMWRHSHK